MFVFLFCSERSGSNLVTTLMGSHSKVSGPPPSHLFRLFGLNEENYLPTTTSANWNQFVTDLVAASNSMIGEWESRIEANSVSESCPEKRIAEALTYLYRAERGTGEEISFVKENHTYQFLPFLLQNWSDCKFVHMVRDPRDVAASWICTPNAKGGVERAVRTWLTDQTRTIEEVTNLGIEHRCAEIRYEDLIANTEHTLTRLCQHLGLEYEKTMLEFHTSRKVRRNAKRISAWRNLAKPVLADNSGKHATVLTEVDIRYIELSCHRLMKRYGYNLESDFSGYAEAEIQQELGFLQDNVSQSRVVERNPDGMNELRRQRENIIRRVKSRVPI